MALKLQLGQPESEHVMYPASLFSGAIFAGNSNLIRKLPSVLVLLAYLLFGMKSLKNTKK